MTDHDDDDQDFDAFLRGEDELSALLRGVPQPPVPPELDARVHAQARAALAAPAEPSAPAPSAANDPVDADATPGPSRPLGRLRTPLALAATVVLGVSLGLQWDGWREPARPVSDAAPALPAADSDDRQPLPKPEVATAPASTPAVSVGAGTGRKRHVQAPPAAVSSDAPRAPTAGAAPPAPPAPLAPARLVEKPPLAMPAPAATLPQDGVWRRAPVPQPEPRADGAVSRYAAPPVSEGAGPAANQVMVSGSRVQAHGPVDAERWLAQIAALLDQHRDADARASWQAFERAYPEADVPPELRARLDALPPATP